ncbi:hypothetical protein K0M31_019549, partial [Melipona bicolor]
RTSGLAERSNCSRAKSATAARSFEDNAPRVKTGGEEKKRSKRERPGGRKERHAERKEKEKRTECKEERGEEKRRETNEGDEKKKRKEPAWKNYRKEAVQAEGGRRGRRKKCSLVKTNPFERTARSSGSNFAIVPSFDR